MLAHLILLSLSLAAAPAADPLPEGWSPAELAQALAPPDEPAPEVKVLAWLIEQDDRPLYLERALVWARSGKTWRLASVYRHPRDNRPWKLSRVWDAPQEPLEAYDHPPTAKEAVAFMGTSWWSMAPSPGFKVLRSGVCEYTWRELFGAPPRPETWPKSTR